MKKIFDKITRQQLQEGFADLNQLAKNQPPKFGWIKAIRHVLGLSNAHLAKKMKCTQPNITGLELREQKKLSLLKLLNKLLRQWTVDLSTSLFQTNHLSKFSKTKLDESQKSALGLLNTLWL